MQAMERVLAKISESEPVDKNAENYEVYVAKKSGKPQLDFPPFQTMITLEKASNQIFTLVHVADRVRTSKRKATASPLRSPYENSLARKQS